MDALKFIEKKKSKLYNTLVGFVAVSALCWEIQKAKPFSVEDDRVTQRPECEAGY